MSLGKAQFKKKKDKFLCCVISGGFQYGDMYILSNIIKE